MKAKQNMYFIAFLVLLQSSVQCHIAEIKNIIFWSDNIYERNSSFNEQLYHIIYGNLYSIHMAFSYAVQAIVLYNSDSQFCM